MQEESAAQIVKQPSLDGTRKRKTFWAQCEICESWRRLPKELQKQVDGQESWYCSQNPDANYSSCNVPQEMSNEAIDRELEGGSEDDGGLCKPLHKLKPAVWQQISANIFTHREKKTQHEDDIMICACPKPANGKPGCGPHCLNRQLNIECHPDWCPCGDQCTNQMFSQKHYAKINQRRAGAKGFGLFACEDLQANQFIIEYIGEVLEEEEYHRRKGYYLDSLQRHYYFMNVGNGEVIDACRKGALGRFINHSCEPNCETQKWVVQGSEIAIGLFTTKAIPANTELTFDYNFERYGDKPLKCLCGSALCRGFIGGKEVANRMADPRGVDEPVDASEEPEPIMVGEAEQDELVEAILDANVGLRQSDTRKFNKLAGRHNVSKNWDTESSSEEESEGEGVAETGSKGSMNQPAHPSSSRVQSDAETEHSTQRPRPHLQRDSESKAAKRMLDGHKRLTNGASLSKQDQAELQHVRSSLLQLTSRKRSQATSGVDRDSSPSTSTAAQSQDRAHRRTASANEGGATSKPYKPARGVPRQKLQQWREPVPEKRRSEVDRRLDSLINTKGSGALKDVQQNTVLRLLRLFNLCDLGTNSADKDKIKHAFGSPRRVVRPRHVQNAVDHSEVSDGKRAGSREERQAHSSSTSGLKQLHSLGGAHNSPADPKVASSQVKLEAQPDGVSSCSAEQKPGDATAALAKGQLVDGAVRGRVPAGMEDNAASTQVKIQTDTAKSDARPEPGEISNVACEGAGKGGEGDVANGSRLTVKLAVRVKGDEAVGGSPVAVLPEIRLRDRDAERSSMRSLERRQGTAVRRHRSRSRSRDRSSREGDSPFSRGTDTEDGEVKEPSSPIRAGPLSARQQARVADLSLLLDVILKTNYYKAPEALVEWGTLRQLHTTLNRCIGPHLLEFDVIMRKMLEVVRALPFSADDVHHTRNAHGTFADTLREVADRRQAARLKIEKTIPTLTIAAIDLLKAFPTSSCKHPVEPNYRPRSPRSLSSPGRGFDRGRRPSFSMPLGRAPTGRIVDWKPPGKEAPHKSAGNDSSAQQGSKDTQKAEQIPPSGAKPKVSPESAAGRPSPQIMRATYSQPQADATPAKAPVAHHHVPSPQPFATPANRPSPPVGLPPTSLGRSHSLASGQHEARSTPSNARSLHRLHSVRGPSSPPSAPSPSVPTGLLGRFAPLPPALPPPPPIPPAQPPAGPAPPPKPAGPAPPPYPPPPGTIPGPRPPPPQHPRVSASGTAPPGRPTGLASPDANPPLPLSPDPPPLPLSPPPPQPLAPPPQQGASLPAGRPPFKDFGFPPHLSELRRKKRKREDLNPEAQGKPAGDMSLDEGEIPVESQSGLAGPGLHASAVHNSLSLSRPSSADGASGQAVPMQSGPACNGYSRPDGNDMQVHGDSNGLHHSSEAGLERFPMDWPDANLTENDNFLSFVDYAVRQSLEPYREGQGHNGLLLSENRYQYILSKCRSKVILAEQQAAKDRAASRQSGQVVLRKVHGAATKLVMMYISNESQPQKQKGLC